MKVKMTLMEKHELCNEHAANPNVSYSSLALWATQKFGLSTTPAKSTICNILKRHATRSLRSDHKERTNDRRVKLPDVEQSVLQWVLRCEKIGVCITGDIIRERAQVVCDQLNISPEGRLAFSRGWLYKFQRKHGLSCKYQHGEAGSVPQEVVDEGRQETLQETSGYSPSNVYNMDETGLFYCLSPHRSITRNRVPGTKASKKRITMALTTNGDGSDLVDPLFIGTAARPRCFRGLSPRDVGFDYHFSKKAWMNADIFNAYLTALNAKMVVQDRKILLLVDNAPPHMLLEETPLTNVKLKMLPKNTTAYLQPQDAGIIASFKAKYRKKQVQNALDQIDAVMEGRQDGLFEVPLNEAMQWAKDAWASVTPATFASVGAAN
ncbi:Aste57867_8297 [Aphanomyces stellatus]|uniref:Aste57867_8297 protein n=1 Tax=Aphanomyces stellatus TaxID=120398 RepID=A0A485KK14_9STRA|nr:hypothetical protein As57867_008266 [Aphanomyces stellatus]VFT85184.1 Aste57867_8297 [Aphanomyces stellatus]